MASRGKDKLNGQILHRSDDFRLIEENLPFQTTKKLRFLWFKKQGFSVLTKLDLFSFNKILI